MSPSERSLMAGIIFYSNFTDSELIRVINESIDDELTNIEEEDNNNLNMSDYTSPLQSIV